MSKKSTKSVFKVPFNKPHLTTKELSNIEYAQSLGQLAGDGYFTQKCQEWIEKNLETNKCLLTHSCTGALEMMSVLVGIGENDEVIMPSFTFTSTANAFAIRGATPVFVDIRMDTKNIDESLIEDAINDKTKAIVPVHYAGVASDMAIIKKIARKYDLFVLEDAAQGILAKYNGAYLGTIGDMGVLSFHETKNIISGQGGALLINNSSFSERADVIRDAGTNKKKFLRGQVDQYSWVDIGSSYLAGELVASVLFAQLEKAHRITRKRIELWNRYHEGLKDLEEKGYIKRPVVPKGLLHNAHIYYILLDDIDIRTDLISYLKDKGILSVFHYVPLHSSKAGKKYGRAVGDMRITNKVSNTLLRLPLYYGLTFKNQRYVIKSVKDYFKKKLQ